MEDSKWGKVAAGIALAGLGLAMIGLTPEGLVVFGLLVESEQLVTAGAIAFFGGVFGVLLSLTPMANWPVRELPSRIRRSHLIGRSSRPFELTDSFPEIMESVSLPGGRRQVFRAAPITRSEVREIYLQFNNPVDRDTVRCIGNMYRRAPRCQWDICGWIEYAERDTEIIWHVNDDDLKNDAKFAPIKGDAPNFEIYMGWGETRLRDIYGNELSPVLIEVEITEDTSSSDLHTEEAESQESE